MLLEEVIAQDYTVVGEGRWRRTLEHDSLVINTETQVFHWNSRGIHYGTVKDWIEKVKKRKYNGLDIVEVIPETVIEEPTSVIVDPDLIDAFYRAGVKHRDYWHEKRGYTDETISRFRLGYSGEFYTIPIFEDGKFVNFQCRKDNPKTVRHWYRGVGPHTFNFSILSHYNWVVITEGPPDAIILRQNNIPAVSQTSGAGDIKLFIKNFHRFYHLNKVYVVYDNDEAGRKGSIKLQSIFGNKLKVYNMWDFKDKYDVTDFFKDGYSKQDFINLLENKSMEMLDE